MDPPTYSTEVKRVTLWGLAANLVLSGVKLTGGILGSSQAVVADEAEFLKTHKLTKWSIRLE